MLNKTQVDSPKLQTISCHFKNSNFSSGLGLPIGLIIDFALIIITTISSRKLIWIFQSIFVIPGLLIGGFTLALWMCTVFILFSYYKLRFDQINKQINQMISNGKCKVIDSKGKNY